MTCELIMRGPLTWGPLKVPMIHLVHHTSHWWLTHMNYTSPIDLITGGGVWLRGPYHTSHAPGATVPAAATTYHVAGARGPVTVVVVIVIDSSSNSNSNSNSDSNIDT